MKSMKCARCGMVNWVAAEACKRCGVQLQSANDAPFMQPAYASPYQSAPYAYPQPYAYQQSYPEAKKSTGVAVASLVVGIVSLLTLSFLGIGALTGIVLGIVALAKIKNNPAQYGGQGLAIAGLVTSALSVLIAIPLAIIMAIAIPNLLASRRAANEGSAINQLRNIASQEAVYQATTGDGDFGTLQELRSTGSIDSTLDSGTHRGYRFTVRVKPRTREALASFEAVATPMNYGDTGNRSFYIDETGVIRATNRRGAEADASDPPLESVRFRGTDTEP